MAKITKKDTEDNVEFEVLKPVKHNGIDYLVGDIILLVGKESVALLELGVVEVSAEPISSEAQQESETQQEPEAE